ncbi:alpha/beta fold hydrolase [Nocardia sp. NPDC057668]|uniref:alpha/beta fold hydrolase n=1 Tax=Nocardia sp. NPDC057668 TaxID=3346202 RepID=UPI00366AAA20
MTSPRARTISLPTGPLGLVDYGDPAGAPVVYCHGAPGSHVEAVAFDAPAAAAGIRLIAIDRPGMGLTPMGARQRVVADWAEAVAALADHLDLDRFAVVGVSGGGPHALACAHRLGDRVSAVAVVSGPAPLETLSAAAELDEAGRRRRRLLALLRTFPLLSRPLAARLSMFVHKPGGIDALVGQMCPRDRELIAADPELADKLQANITEAFRQGSHGVAADLQSLTSPWGFRLADIAVPVHVWHGESDNNVPLLDGRHLAAALPNSRLTVLPGVGHLLFVHHAAEILDGLRQSDPAERR